MDFKFPFFYGKIGGDNSEGGGSNRDAKKLRTGRAVLYRGKETAWGKCENKRPAHFLLKVDLQAS